MGSSQPGDADRVARVRAQFGRSAADYARSGVHASGESLGVLLELVRPAGGRLLDVATGAGHTAVAFAPFVGEVVATDITPEMLEQTAQLAAGRRVTNLSTALAPAEALPFPDGSFDIVTCRLAAHHFDDYLGALQEMARVVRPGGVIGLTDNVTVEDPTSAAYYNEFEALRDPSHHRVLPESELFAVFREDPPAGAGLQVQASRRLTKEFEFHEWADRQRVPPQEKKRLDQMMHAMPEALGPLFRPRWADGTLYFSLWELVVVARRP